MKDRLIELFRKTEYQNRVCGPKANLATQFTEYGLNQIVDSLLDNGVIVLPCKVGDTVYRIENNTDACRNECPHFSSFYGMDEMCDKDNDIVMNPWVSDKPICDKQFYEIIEYCPDIDWIFNYRKQFGKTVFLTKEEAEKALTERTKE